MGEHDTGEQVFHLEMRRGFYRILVGMQCITAWVYLVHYSMTLGQYDKNGSCTLTSIHALCNVSPYHSSAVH